MSKTLKPIDRRAFPISGIEAEDRFWLVDHLKTLRQAEMPAPVPVPDLNKSKSVKESADAFQAYLTAADKQATARLIAERGMGRVTRILDAIDKSEATVAEQVAKYAAERAAAKST